MNLKTVLIIEDNIVNMKLTVGLLDLLGCRVLEAQEAETGLSILQEEEVDLVLLDINLPGMDGINACRVIRQEMGREDLPVIAVSALAMEEDVRAAMEAGFDDYLTKPVNTKEFVELVSGWLSGTIGKGHRPRIKMTPRPNLKRVLIVDDDRTNVKLLKSMLSEDPYEIMEAYSGQQALDAAAEFMPDVIFLDIMMPDIDGFEVTRRLKAEPETACIPIVLVTALEGMEDRVQGFTLGAEDVLVKPVKRVEVRSRARSMVRLSEYQKQLNIRQQAAGSFPLEVLPPGKIKIRRRPSVLLVEDSKQDAHMFLVNFGESGFDVDVAKDGKQALKWLDKKEFDLVLLDLILPDMDGLEILRRIRETKGQDSVQVVIITALGDLDTRLKGIEQGADDFLVKPVHPRELQARIQVLIRKKGYIDDLREGYQNALNSAITDNLTGIYNEAYMNRHLELEVRRSKRHKYPISVVMADIDGFKGYSSRFGPMVGDLVIKEVAAVLKRTFRAVDLVARLGGDKFVMILPYCSAREVEEIVRRARNAVQSHPFPTEDDLVAGSVSISTATATYPQDGLTAEDLINKADSELQKVRDRGETKDVPFKEGAAK